MSLPRRILPGSRYLLTRRTAHRQFLLRPGELTNRIVEYALAEAALFTGVVLHAFVAMGNHFHAVVTDPHGRVPEFLHRLDRHIACCMNASLGRTENFWSSDPASVVVLQTEDDVLDKIAYVIANPTAAGLVLEPAEWPGVITPVGGMRKIVARPGVFFRSDGKMPASIELDASPPAPIAQTGVGALVERLRELVEEKLRVAKAVVAEAGKQFLGRHRVLAASRSRTASTPEPVLARRPQVAARDKHRRRGAFDELRAFHAHYTKALDTWRAGDRQVVFPALTYLMRLLHGAFAEPALSCDSRAVLWAAGS